MTRVTDREGDWTGIYYEVDTRGCPTQFRVIAHGGGRRQSAWYPLETPLSTLKAWRKDTAATLQTQRKRRASQGTFEGDARRYLRAVTNLDDYRKRVKHIEWWIGIFGTRRRDSITTADILEERNRLADQPYDYQRTKRRLPRGTDPHVYDAAGEKIPRFYSASEINQRLRALSNLWTVLDPEGSNPVRYVPELPQPEPEARGIAPDVVLAIFAAMPDRGRPPKRRGGVKGTGNRPTVSIAKWWLKAEYFGGLTHAQLERVNPETEINWTAGLFKTQRRRKGKGVPGDWKPIAQPGMEALAQLHALGVLGTKRSASAFRKAFIGGARRAGYAGKVTPYDLRHSFAAIVFEQTGNRALVQMLLQQRDARTTDRYMKTATMRVLQRTVDDVTARLAGAAAPSAHPGRPPVDNSGIAWSFSAKPKAAAAAGGTPAFQAEPGGLSAIATAPDQELP